MNISFSTTCASSAKRYFDKPDYDWLNDEAKEYVIANLGDGLRVQDPMMYPQPNIEFHGDDALKHRDRLVELLGRVKEATDAEQTT